MFPDIWRNVLSGWRWRRWLRRWHQPNTNTNYGCRCKNVCSVFVSVTVSLKEQLTRLYPWCHRGRREKKNKTKTDVALNYSRHAGRLLQWSAGWTSDIRLGKNPKKTLDRTRPQLYSHWVKMLSTHKTGMVSTTEIGEAAAQGFPPVIARGPTSASATILRKVTAHPSGQIKSHYKDTREPRQGHVVAFGWKWMNGRLFKAHLLLS